MIVVEIKYKKKSAKIIWIIIKFKQNKKHSYIKESLY